MCLFIIRMERINSKPVYNLVLVQVLEAQDYTGCIKNGSRLCKHVSMDVHHEVTTSCVFHHEANVRLNNRIH